MEQFSLNKGHFVCTMSREGDRKLFAKCVRIFYGMGEEIEDKWLVRYNRPELNKYFNNYLSHTRDLLQKDYSENS